MVQLSCPDTSRWEALLADSAPDAAELEAHLAACPRCRSTLDDLAVGSSGWLRDAGRLAAETDRDPEMTKTLHRLRDALADDHSGPPIPLDFLTPSDQPGILGTLGRYQVLEVIGRGAMGIVLKALDPDLLRPVALKVMAPYLAPSGTARERFKREARAAAAVSHDHIVTIHAVEEGNGLPYLVMEYISGISLQARIDRDGPLPPRDIARIGHQAARGLAMAHQQGLVHRDVKPANILLENGVERVKLTDFGLARAADDARLTQSGTAAGTPLYMSPEQAHGDTLIDARSDLFSLGSVLYTLATGFPPFRSGTTMGVLNRISNDPPRPIRDTIPDFPPALERIIMQLLEKNPARRFQSADEVANRLTEFLAATPFTPERPKARRGWLVAAGLALAAVLLVGGVILTFKTPKGTLVVEVDDPAIKVALDGEELTITGAGPQEVRLKPGTYRVTATKDGKPAAVSQDIVTIKKDGREIVKVTFRPEPGPMAAFPRALAGDIEKLLEERIKQVIPNADADRVELMLQVWRSTIDPALVASLPEPLQSSQSYRMFANQMERAVHLDTDPERSASALRSAYNLAGAALTSTFAKKGPPPKAGPTKADGWASKLAELKHHFDSFAGRLGNTDAGRIVSQPAAVGRDTAANRLTEPIRGRVKQLLAQRDQWAKLYADAQESARGLARAQNLVANSLRQGIEDKLQTQYGTLRRQLTDMDKLAAELGAQPYVPPIDWDERATDLRDQFERALRALSATPAGRAVAAAPPASDPDKATAGLSGPDRDRAKRALALRDQIGLLLPKFDQSANSLTHFRQQFARAEQGLKAIALTPADQQRLETTAQQQYETLVGLVGDLKSAVADLGPAAPPTDFDAQLKKIQADYDAVIARLKKTPPGKILQTITYPVDVEKATARLTGPDLDRASRLLSLVSHYGTLSPKSVPEVGQWDKRKVLAEEARLRFAAGVISQAAYDAAQAELKDSERVLTSYVDTLGGIVTDLTTLAAEFEASATPEGQFKQVMAEYDALVIRLARHPVGRMIVIVDRPWDDGHLERRTDLSNADRPKASRLLKLRDQIQVQAEKAKVILRTIDGHRTTIASFTAQKAEASVIAGWEGAIHREETPLKVCTETIRGLLTDMTKLADELDPPKKMAPPKGKD
jgi:hypothetical protein